jgi:hypothetical protein
MGLLEGFAGGLGGFQRARARRDQEDYNQKRIGLLENEDKRAQADFDREQKQRGLNKLYTAGRDNEWIMQGAGKGGKDGIGLTDKLKQSMTEAGSNAQRFALANINAGGASKFPPGFKVTVIESKGTNEDGEEVFAARGNYNGDPEQFGALTVTGSNDPDAETKLFTRDELFEQTQQAFRTTDGGVLYGQTLIDLHDRRNNVDLINAYNTDQLADKALEVGGPELQREVTGVIASATDPKDKAEAIGKLADDLQVDLTSEVPKQEQGVSQSTIDAYDDFASGGASSPAPNLATPPSDNKKPVMESPVTTVSQTSTGRVAADQLVTEGDKRLQAAMDEYRERTGSEMPPEMIEKFVEDDIAPAPIGQAQPPASQSAVDTQDLTEVARLEDELASIEARKTSNSPANVAAAERKREEIAAAKEQASPRSNRPMPARGAAEFNRQLDEGDLTLKPQPESNFKENVQSFVDSVFPKGIPDTRSAEYQQSVESGEAMPPVVEEKAAPALEGKSVKQIDDDLDNERIPELKDPEVVQAAAEDLRKEGVETVADLAKLSRRKQLLAYAMIVASTPNDGNRVNVRNQLINVLETGLSDRGKSVVDAQKADTAARRLYFDAQVRNDNLRKEGWDAAATANEELINAMYKNEDGDIVPAQLTKAKANEVANTLFPKVLTQWAGFLDRGNIAAAEALRPQLNAGISFVVQSLVKDGEETLLDSFLTWFNPDPQGQFNGDLSNIFLADVKKNQDGEIIGGELVYVERNQETGNRLDISQLQAINDNLALMVLKAAKLNTEQRLKQSGRDG